MCHQWMDKQAKQCLLLPHLAVAPNATTSLSGHLLTQARGQWNTDGPYWSTHHDDPVTTDGL
jgi:hypothetical protein